MSRTRSWRPDEHFLTLPGGSLGRLTGSRSPEPPYYGILASVIAPDWTLWLGGGFGVVGLTTDVLLEFPSLPVARLVWFQNQLWGQQTGRPNLIADLTGRPTQVTLPFQPEHGIRCGEDGALWLNGDRAPGLWRSEDGYQWHCLAGTQAICVHQFSFADDGSVWLIDGEHNTLSHWQHGQITTVALPNNRYVISDEIQFLRCDNDRTVWLGTDRVGLWSWDGEQWRQMPAARGFDDTGIFGRNMMAMYIDSHDRRWVSTIGGLSISQHETWFPTFVSPQVEHDDDVLPIMHLMGSIETFSEDASGRIWCGSSAGEVIWIEPSGEAYPRHPLAKKRLVMPEVIHLTRC